MTRFDATRRPEEFGRFHNGHQWMYWERHPQYPRAALTPGVWLSERVFPFPTLLIPQERPIPLHEAQRDSEQPGLFGDAA